MINICQKLRQKGYRLTTQRQQVLDCLTGFPQSVEDIVVSLQNHNLCVDRVTVYRTLDCFVELGLVSKTQFQDKIAKYELFSEGHHHHHLVCNNCGSVEDVCINEDSLLNQVSRETDFKIKSHSLEFFGVCGKCQD